MQAADADSYDCVVAIGSLEQSTGNTVVSVRLKPDIQTAAFPTDLIVSSTTLNLPLTIANGITSVVIGGLPSGMIYNKTTGVISGIPNVPMANKPITVTATNLAGTTTKTINLTVAALDPDVVGTFNGLVTRNPEVQANSNYGGYLSNLKVASTGAITGVLKHKQLAHAISGRLIATATNDPGTTLIIKRTGLPDAQLTFTIDRGNGKLTGSLSQALAPAWTADVEAWRNPYDAKNPATTLAGIHNFWMDPPVGTSTAKPQGAGNFVENHLDGKCPLRTTETTKSRIALQIRARQKTVDFDLGQPVGIIEVANSPGHHGRRKVRRKTGIANQCGGNGQHAPQ